MFSRLLKNWNENSILRFLGMHLLILLMTLMICAIGFQSAFAIVREDILNSTEFAMEAAADNLDATMVQLRTLGLEIAHSESFAQFAQTDKTDENYYSVARAALNEYYQRLLYSKNDWTWDSFIYLNEPDRVIFRNAVYTPNVFAEYIYKWGDDLTAWQGLGQNAQTLPYMATLGGGGIYYAIPSRVILGPKLGTVFFRVDDAEISSHLSYLNQYELYSFFVMSSRNDAVLYQRDDLGIEAALPAEWKTRFGTWSDEQKLILHLRGTKEDAGLHYLLVLPEQDAMRRLLEMRNKTFVLILAAGLLGMLMSLAFSMRSGKPVNAMARALYSPGNGPVTVDLNHISSAVSTLLQDNAQLLEEQAADLPALQTAFFHNLLKSDFVSRAEMEYMAGRASIALTGKSYCAASLRLFTGIDVDAIDNQTVEDARVLQPVISAHIDEVCARPVWSYKRRTLETLYIFEIVDQQKLVEVLRSTALWLREKYHVEVRWGVGLPCNDLMQFWRSAEEAGAALAECAEEESVALYNATTAAKDDYYFPYVLEERLMQGISAGDGETVETALAVLQQENFVRRALNRSQARRANRRIMEILLAQMEIDVESSPELMELNALAFEFNGDCEPYFEKLNTLCQRLCKEAANRKSARRSENVRAIEAYLRQQYRDPDLGLAKVSSAFELSEGYLSAIFKKETGTNFAEYLEKLRIRAACVLLEDGVKIADLPQRVGYNSIQSFRRAFKRVMGVSPSEYRT